MTKGSKSGRRLSPRLAGVLAAMAALGAVTEANAQVLSRFALRGEFGGGTMLASHQRDVLGYDSFAIQATGRLGITLVGPVALQLGVANWFFPAANDSNGAARDTGRVLAPMAGLRFEPRLGPGRFFIDVNGGYAFTGDDRRFTFDAGLGYEFQVTRAFHIGPAVRYGQVFQQAEVDGIAQNFPDKDASYFSVGLSIALRYPPDEAAAPSDRDGDGVVDADDQCVDVPAGPTPDPNRQGCPAPTDRDSDGVNDDNDQCPDVPQGDHPDPARNGCPIADQDHDGVLDSDDQCPTEPQGATPDPARRGCPAGDRDRDGVIDPEDQCVDVPAGARPSTARRGCPAPDADHDGIIDQPEGPDQCPDRPETFNGNQDDDGCPDGAALAEQVGTQIRILQQVNFRTDSDEITGRQSFQVLEAVVGILRAMTNITAIDVQGHTDDRGAADHNRDLSNRRAASVVHYLTEHGLEAGRLSSHGFGPDCPAIPGTSRAARAANRRVQFVIVSPETPAGQCVNGVTIGTPSNNANPAPPAEEGGRHGRRHRRH
ncbi:MAG: OmpA family protein [Myxococcales bacterium]|nr:OmpA family protein [Myxococcales bacterium]